MELITNPKVRFEKTQLVFDESISQEEWEDVGRGLKKLHGRIQFYIGDWARFGEKQGFTGKYVKSQVYDKLEEITGYDRGTLKNFKSVAEKTSSSRNDDLTFSHHKIVSPLPPEEQKKLLDEAALTNMPLLELKNRVLISDTSQKKGKASKQKATAVHQRIGKPPQVKRISTAHEMVICDLPAEAIADFERRVLRENMTVEDLKIEVKEFLLDYSIRKKKIFDLPQILSHPNWKEYFDLLAEEIHLLCSDDQKDYLTTKLI